MGNGIGELGAEQGGRLEGVECYFMSIISPKVDFLELY